MASILPVNILWGFSSPGLPDKKLYFVLAFSSAGCSRARASNIWLEWRLCRRHEIAFEPEVLPLQESILFQARIIARASVAVGSRFVAKASKAAAQAKWVNKAENRHSLPGSGKCGAGPAMAKAASGLLARKRPLHDKRLARYKISPLSEIPGPDLGNYLG